MQCLSVADPSMAEHMLAQLRSIDPGLTVDGYGGGALQWRRYDVIVVGSHLTSRGVHLGGDAYLSPLALGSMAETAKASAVFVASCDGAAVALDIANQARAAAVVYYPAALDGDTAARLAASFVERYTGDNPQSAIQVAQAAGYQVLNPIWTTMAPGDGFGGNPELTRLLLDMQRQQTETAADVRYLREEVKRIADAQAAAGNVPLRNILFILSVAVVVTVLGWVTVNALSVRGF